ncbi:MAG: glycoside hydrolase family 5 protein [Chitinophagaceae bacterium]
MHPDIYMIKRNLLCVCYTAITIIFSIPTAAQTFSSAKTLTLLHRKENLIVNSNGKAIWLKGIGFGNNFWSSVPIPVKHHTEADFKRVKDMGMNVIRFYLNYRTFESDANPFHYKAAGFSWLDKNIAWAKKYNIYLILDMHVPQGGVQSGGDGIALWKHQNNQKRLEALWQIAKHYAKEPIIAGYDLVNEPVVTDSIEQWKHLAQQLVDTIRQVDTNHLLIVERLNAIGKTWKDFNGDNNFFLVNDKNTMYTFHFYQPFRYIHQLAGWAKMPDGGQYPDDSKVEQGGLPRNKAYLEQQVDQYLEFGRRNNVPVYMGEFGRIQHCFKNNKGGIAWVADMLDILQEKKLHFSYHVYHEDEFGVYYGDEKAVDTSKANFALINLFKKSWPGLRTRCRPASFENNEAGMVVL